MTKAPEPIKKGDIITASWLNQLLMMVMRKFRVGPGMTLQQTGDKIVIGLAQRYHPIPQNNDSYDYSLVQTGGDSGDEDNECSYTYSVYPFGDTSATALATAVDPTSNPTSNPSVYQRPALGAMVAANWARARWVDNAGTPTLLILWCNEVIDRDSCDEES